MNRIREIFARSHIAHRLVIAIVLFSSLITVVTTAIQLYIDYKHDLGRIDGYMELIENGYLKSLVNSVWLYDETQISTQLDGLLRLQDIEYVEIRENQKYTWSAGAHRSNHTVEKNFSLVKNYNGQDYQLGTLRIIASIDDVLQRLIDKFLVILISNAFKTFLVSGFILLIFQRLVTRHLNKLAARVHEIDIGRDWTPVVLDRPSPAGREPDELDHLVSAVNTMQNNLSVYVKEIEAAERARRKSEGRYRQLIETANDAIYIAQDGVIKFPNPQTLKLVEYSAEELLQTPFIELIHPDDRDMVLRRHVERLQGGKPPSTYSFRILSKSARELWVQLSTSLIEWDDRPATINFLRDITELKRIEGRLQQAHKMEAIGTLAGGIAHDFNNILSAILGYTELALLDLPSPNPAREVLLQTMKAGTRARDLVRQILTFSRKAQLDKHPLDLAPIIEEGLNFLRASLPATIEIRQQVESGLGAVVADSTQIHQVLMNLCANASHAMRDGEGVLTVALTRIQIGSPQGHSSLELEPGAYLKLVVSDTGHGMAPQVAERIFEPFFTTKGVGEGSGMGLAVVHGIVKSHGGEIAVQSEPGRGAAFQIYLPVSDRILSPEIAVPDTSMPSGSENILFVDDEDDLVNVGRQILTRLGYTVTPRSSGLSALETFKNDPSLFDLIITDQTMPEMTGLEFISRVLTIRPDIPAILCTGYSRLVTEETALEHGARRFIMKPLDYGDVARIIREVLDENHQADTESHRV